MFPRYAYIRTLFLVLLLYPRRTLPATSHLSLSLDRTNERRAPRRPLLERCLWLWYKEHTETRNRVGFLISVSVKCRFDRILAMTTDEKM